MGYLQVERLSGVGRDVHVMKVGRYNANGFVQLYLDGNEAYFSLSGLEHKVLSYCMLVCDFLMEGSGDKGNRVVVNSGVRACMREKLGVSDGGIRNALSGLVRKGQLLSSGHRGVYYLNPEYFFKGTVSMRATLLSVHENGCISINKE